MKGARKYANLFKTGQYGKLYIVSGSHARGKTFRVFVLAEGEKAITNGPNNAPLNSNAVEVYGVVSGDPGWTESYGWLHHGKWEEDFARLDEERSLEAWRKSEEHSLAKIRQEEDRRSREAILLAEY